MDERFRQLFEGIMNDPDDEQIQKFAIQAAASESPRSQATGALVASEFYLAKSLKGALAAHADALSRSANASEKHAKSLTRATWALTIATVVMAIATILNYLRPVN